MSGDLVITEVQRPTAEYIRKTDRERPPSKWSRTKNWLRKHARSLTATGLLLASPTDPGQKAIQAGADIGASAVRENPGIVVLARARDAISDASDRQFGVIKELDPKNLRYINKTTIRINLDKGNLRSNTSVDTELDSTVPREDIVEINGVEIPSDAPSILVSNYPIVEQGDNPDNLNNVGPGLWVPLGEAKLGNGRIMPLYISYSSKTREAGFLEMPDKPHQTEPALVDELGRVYGKTTLPQDVSKISVERPTP